MMGAVQRFPSYQMIAVTALLTAVVTLERRITRLERVFAAIDIDTTRGPHPLRAQAVNDSLRR